MDSNKINIATQTIINTFKEEEINLDKIILFGSSVNENKLKSNDLDFIIISKSFRRKKYDERIYRLINLNSNIVKKTNKPIDLLYYSDKEWDSDSTLLIREAKKKGRIIYQSD